MTRAYFAVIVPAFIGLLLALYAWLTPGTGVAGTPGALLAVLGALAVTLGGLVAGLRSTGSGVRRLLQGLLVLGAALTALAAWFLMQTGLTVAMLLSLAGILVVLFLPNRSLA